MSKQTNNSQKSRFPQGGSEPRKSRVQNRSDVERSSPRRLAKPIVSSRKSAAAINNLSICWKYQPELPAFVQTRLPPSGWLASAKCAHNTQTLKGQSGPMSSYGITGSSVARVNAESPDDQWFTVPGRSPWQSAHTPPRLFHFARSASRVCEARNRIEKITVTGQIESERSW